WAGWVAGVPRWAMRWFASDCAWATAWADAWSVWARACALSASAWRRLAEAEATERRFAAAKKSPTAWATLAPRPVRLSCNELSALACELAMPDEPAASRSRLERIELCARVGSLAMTPPTSGGAGRAGGVRSSRGEASGVDVGGVGAGTAVPGV